ncbi:unnamed protein product [Ostreobium quekettii]|uniref:phosphoacetylglucosamine mutase n=1 Tax=Ostreobium quekettii TaxID=121088 RepID=A0A8S1INB1_9CHLO|nr:unnamed protein product [Ostreobium quekettii]
MPPRLDPDRVRDAASRFPPDADGDPPPYGTAGFRAQAPILPPVLLRCGLLAAIKSLAAGKMCGVMVTASHNPEEDNGAKLIGPVGEMMSPEWEDYANRLVAAGSDDQLAAEAAAIWRQEGIDSIDEGRGGPVGGVVVGCDNRPSAGLLVEAALAGVACTGVPVVRAGLQTTPQLHFRVRARNLGQPWGEADYYDRLAMGLAKASRDLVGDAVPGRWAAVGTDGLLLDCANGVGAAKAEALIARLREAGCGWRFDVRNVGPRGLNDRVGADHVEKQRALPLGFETVAKGARCCSIDGDADRLVYFAPDGKRGLTLFDGNKIAALLALYIKDALKGMPGIAETFKVGVVQTAYANGASTNYLKTELGLQPVMTSTGVKHLHREAASFDVGVYFEANGHGTVLFSNDLIAKLRKIEYEDEAARDLLAMAEVMNQAVGDALSGMLMVECILRRKVWGLKEWEDMYTDLPSRQLKVMVADRAVIKTTDAETRCIAPDSLQQGIDAAVARRKSGRAFARPSGTENVVRIYAEAASQGEADSLAKDVARLVHKLAGGIGPVP